MADTPNLKSPADKAKSLPPVAATAPNVTKQLAAAEPAAKPADPAPIAKVAAADPVAKLAQPVVAPLTSEGKETVNETFTKIEDTAQNFTAKAASSVNSAFDKGSKGIADLVEFSKGNLEAVVASTRVAANGVQEIAAYVTDYGRTSIEKTSTSAKQFASVKSPVELFQLQSDLVKSSFASLAAEASKFGENYIKLLGDVARPLQSRYEVAVEKVKTSAFA